MGEERILVSVEHSDGIAAVYEGDDGYWLTGIVGHGGTGLRGYTAVLEGLGDGRSVHGGITPEGTVRVEVVDHTGERQQAAVANGAWIILLHDGSFFSQEVPVAFIDADGNFVVPPIPGAWARSPVEDAREPCPICGECDWEEVIPEDDSRGMVGVPPPGGAAPAQGPGDVDWDDVDWTPAPFVRCRTCGFEDGGGTVMRAVAREGPPTPEEVAAHKRLETEHRARARAALAEVTFPVYAPRERKVTLGGWSGGSSHPMGPPDAPVMPTSGVTVSTDQAEDNVPGLSIESSVADEYFDDEDSTLREALETLVDDDGLPEAEISDAALKLWFSGRRRKAKRLAAAATIDRRTFIVDGAPREFRFARLADNWAAVHRDGSHQITITSHDVDADDLTIERLTDPESLELRPWGRG